MPSLEQRDVSFSPEFRAAPVDVVKAAKIAVFRRNWQLSDIGSRRRIDIMSPRVFLGTLHKARNASEKIERFRQWIHLDRIPEEVVYYDTRSVQARNEELPNVRLGYKSERPYFQIAGKPEVDIFLTVEWFDAALYSPNDYGDQDRVEGFEQNSEITSLFMVILGNDFIDWGVARISTCQKF
jgi:hypothetical protein